MLFALALCAGCTPITERASTDDTPASTRESDADDLFVFRDDVGPLDLGDRVPDFELRDRHGNTLMLASFRGRAVVLAFIGPSTDNANDREALRRLAIFARALSPQLADKVHMLTLVLDEDPGSPAVARADGRAPRVNVPWTFVGARPRDAALLAASFGVVAWRAADGDIGHSFNTVVIDPNGRLVDQFPGLEEWSPRDLVAAVALAVGH